MLKKGNVKDFDDYDENGYTPLYYAVINKNLELTKILLDKGCDINRLHQKKETTVLWYAVDTGNVEMVKLLLKYNPDLSIKSKDNFYTRKSYILGTGIDASTNNGRKQKYEIVKLLLEAGCNPNATIESDNKNYTITASCCRNGDEDLIELLIEYGGNPFAVWEAWLWNHKYSFSIIRKDIYNEGIDYDKKNAVYRGLVKYYKNKFLVATDNLRIRNGYSRSDGTITAIKKGTKVKVLNADNMEIIDDIHSCWVEVEVLPGSVDSNGKAIPKGTKGWCFLGYLASE
ncbi:ankyrin repeat domain-containing protein [Treponema zioleckii]|uniref:ankyrin repeat domain-containing protein n=1 Tax=Treponema zioleckii TaxID=331680 RepID=UPI00168A849E|nr:ankyrin repeat domain-containing protein [Treponema zioleckii]